MIATISRNLIKSIEWALTIQPMDVILHPSDTNTANQTRDETVKTATINPMTTTTASREVFSAIIRDAVRLPVAGLIKSYRAVQFDDFGNSVVVIIRSTEQVNESGDVTWSECVVA